MFSRFQDNLVDNPLYLVDNLLYLQDFKISSLPSEQYLKYMVKVSPISLFLKSSLGCVHKRAKYPENRKIDKIGR